MDHDGFQILIKKLYSIVLELEQMFPGRHFTPDGHMVGSIGECLVADAYNLKLMTASNKGYDAVTQDRSTVEIKATQSNRVAFRSCPDHTIIIKILADGTFKEYYNGPGTIIWNEFKGRTMPSNGQYQISLRRVEQLNEMVPVHQKLSKIF